MTIQWRVVALVVLVNWLACLAEFGVQQVEARYGKIPPHLSIIPGTQQQFCYWQDWACLTLGDFFGLAMVQVALAHLWLNSHVSRGQKVWLIALMVVGCLIQFSIASRPLHKPDWSYPTAGHPSWGGVLHTLYFGANVGISAICIYHWIYTGALRGKLLWMALFGAVIWLGSFRYDVATGRVASLKIEKS